MLQDQPHRIRAAGRGSHWLVPLVSLVAAVGPIGASPSPVSASATPVPEGAGTHAGQSAPRQASADGACPEDLAVLLPRGLSRETGLTTGDSLRLRPAPQSPPCAARVSGVYVPRADPARLTVRRPRVLFHLPQLARLVGREDEVDRFSVRLREGAEPAAVAGRLSSLLPGARVLPTARVTREASTTFEVVRRFHRAIAAITLAAGGVFLACIMTLKVEERRAPVAALRLVGVSRRTLLGWVAVETAAVAVIGGALGVAIGRGAVWVVNRVYQRIYDTELVFALVTQEVVVLTLAVGALLGLGAGVVAGGRLFTLDALDEVGR